MKTPRQILLEHHRQAEPKLDAVRRKALAALASVNADARRSEPGNWLWVGAALGKVWRELIWPSRRAWAGMAAVWLAVLVANLEMNANSRGAAPVKSAPSGDLVQAFEEQRRLLAELLPSGKPLPAATPQPGSRPRSERSSNLKFS